MVRFGILLTVCSFFIVNAEQEQYDVYWNSSNPLFEPFDNAIDSPGYYELPARPLDIINFHCPRRKAKEYSLIHKIERRDPILGIDVDLQELMQNRFYLAEENGELNWKKNVLPDVEFDWKSYLQNHNRKLKFDKSIQIEPIPLDDNFISRWKQLRNQREQNELGFLSQNEEMVEKSKSVGKSLRFLKVAESTNT
ncbi:unnamed protein product [Angiostrongylus costaricensis]|uniref:Ephrin RBD domain-containing protein n=1 Tax=Angiostrongylus costaricensis TaxID=334426 RepID=A0A0R3PWS4_ANGCS|nr:unnamed protein product [Angiostrongylus costaricensis]